MAAREMLVMVWLVPSIWVSVGLVALLLKT